MASGGGESGGDGGGGGGGWEGGGGEGGDEGGDAPQRYWAAPISWSPFKAAVRNQTLEQCR